MKLLPGVSRSRGRGDLNWGYALAHVCGVGRVRSAGYGRSRSYMAFTGYRLLGKGRER
jgi:hypothetical protein